MPEWLTTLIGAAFGLIAGEVLARRRERRDHVRAILMRRWEEQRAALEELATAAGGMTDDPDWSGPPHHLAIRINNAFGGNLGWKFTRLLARLRKGLLEISPHDNVDDTDPMLELAAEFEALHSTLRAVMRETEQDLGVPPRPRTKERLEAARKKALSRWAKGPPPDVVREAAESPDEPPPSSQDR